MLFEAGGGVGYATGDGVAAWRIPEARLLAAGDGVVFLRRDAEVSAWEVGVDQPLWRLALDEVPLDARFSAGTEAELLLTGAEQLYVVDAISGELKEQRSPIDAASLPPAVGDLDGDGQVEGFSLLLEDRSRLGRRTWTIQAIRSVESSSSWAIRSLRRRSWAIWMAMAGWRWFC